jgi:hypothetical protein
MSTFYPSKNLLLLDQSGRWRRSMAQQRRLEGIVEALYGLPGADAGGFLPPQRVKAFLNPSPSLYCQGHIFILQFIEGRDM